MFSCIVRQDRVSHWSSPWTGSLPESRAMSSFKSVWISVLGVVQIGIISCSRSSTALHPRYLRLFQPCLSSWILCRHRSLPFVGLVTVGQLPSDCNGMFVLFLAFGRLVSRHACTRRWSRNDSQETDSKTTEREATHPRSYLRTNKHGDRDNTIPHHTTPSTMATPSGMQRTSLQVSCRRIGHGIGSYCTKSFTALYLPSRHYTHTTHHDTACLSHCAVPSFILTRLSFCLCPTFSIILFHYYYYYYSSTEIVCDWSDTLLRATLPRPWRYEQRYGCNSNKTAMKRTPPGWKPKRRQQSGHWPITWCTRAAPRIPRWPMP